MPRLHLLFCALLALPLPAAAQEAQTGRIEVSGEGEAFAAPDMATISLGIVTEAPEAADAMAEASAVAARLIARLGESGIAARDLQTSDLSLRPNYVRPSDNEAEMRIQSYIAQNRLTVRVRTLANLGVILGLALEDGANTLDSLSFGLSDPDPLLAEARRAAIADARARAETYAEAAGVGLGQVLSITEADGGGGPMPMAEMRMASDMAVPVAEGETGVTARVNVTYALTP